MAQRGRPAHRGMNLDKIQVSLSDELLREIKEWAAHEDRSVSAMCRALLAEAVEARREGCEI